MILSGRHSLRKTPSRLHIAYKYGGTSDALQGSQFTLAVDGPVLTLGVDLSANYRSRDKAGSGYLDAVVLARDYHKLKLVQCHDNLVRARLVRTWESMASPRLHLALRLGSRATCLYSVLPRSLLMGGIQLDVLSVLDVRRGDDSSRAWRSSGFHASGFQHSGMHL